MTTECRARLRRISHSVVAARLPHAALALHDAAGPSKDYRPHGARGSSSVPWSGYRSTSGPPISDVPMVNQPGAFRSPTPDLRW